jgi:hypothetical protein
MTDSLTINNLPKSYTGINFKIYENGDLYIGNLKRGKIEGDGIIFFENPKIRCEGEWTDGLLNGTGRQIGPEDELFIGEFLDGVKHGQGNYQTNECGILGSFLNGELKGLSIVQNYEKELISKGVFQQGKI